MSSLHPLLINPAGSLADNVDAQFGVIPEAEGTSEIHVPMPHPRERTATPQRRIKPRNIRTALKKLWLDEMLLTKQVSHFPYRPMEFIVEKLSQKATKV